jgi:hypothetical protein
MLQSGKRLRLTGKSPQKDFILRKVGVERLHRQKDSPLAVPHFVNVAHPALSKQGVRAITIGYGFSNEVVHEGILPNRPRIFLILTFFVVWLVGWENIPTNGAFCGQILLKTLPFLGKVGVCFENHKFRQNQEFLITNKRTRVGIRVFVVLFEDGFVIAGFGGR